jgi:hypothetical protein
LGQIRIQGWSGIVFQILSDFAGFHLGLP